MLGSSMPRTGVSGCRGQAFHARFKHGEDRRFTLRRTGLSLRRKCRGQAFRATKIAADTGFASGSKPSLSFSMAPARFSARLNRCFSNE
jgi:hypothetical protein